MAVIRTEKICKVYNPDTIPVHALKDVSIQVEKGEFTSLVGPSGSGKTTLLNMLGALDMPSSGKSFIGDVEVTRLSDRERIRFRLHNIGFVFQHYNLIPVFTARENVSFIMMLQGVGQRELLERADELLESVGLGDRKDARPHELSGGQQQRVAVARALASKPRFILADEPTANLDTKAAMNLLDIMEKMNEEQEVTFIFSTHDQRVIKRARRVVTLVDGAVHSDETTAVDSAVKDNQ
ncbi:MAG: ABC transporter ATP-binding protein [Saprospirales bacterium]|nr:MAG: ABC transporter ATP-binding protein [Saprospirales bacterium]